MILSTRRLFTAILLLLLFAMIVREATDPDLGWHLRAGEYMVENHLIPHVDVFSFTSQGREWVTQEWLTEIIIYTLYRLGGLGLLSILFAGIIALSFALAYWRSAGRPYLAGLVVILGALAAANTWDIRPQMLSLFLTSLFLLLLDAYQAKPRTRYLIPLPLLLIPWVNLHSGYALGPALMAVYLFGIAVDRYSEGSLRTSLPMLGPLTVALCLSLAVVPLNPNGLRMFSYPFETLTSPAMQQYIEEWHSPDFHLLEFQPLALLFLALIGGGVVSRARIPTPWLILVLIFGFAALHSLRNTQFLALVAIPVLSAQLSAILQARARPGANHSTPTPRAFGYLYAGLLVVVFAAVVLHARAVTLNQAQAEQQFFPVQAVRYIQDNQPRGNLYNTYGWGGYILWHLYPEYPPYIDGRADVYGDQFMDDYFKIYYAKPGWDAELLSRGVNLALIDPDSPLAYALANSPGWQQAFADSVSVVFVRKSVAPVVSR